MAVKKPLGVYNGVIGEMPAGDTIDPAYVSGSNYRTLVRINADVTNANSTANTLADTGLEFVVEAGTIYSFRAMIVYNSSGTTNGSRFTVTGPASPTFLAVKSSYTLTATSQTTNFVSGYGLPASAGATSLLNGNIAIIEGVIKPSANGTFKIQFASELAGPSNSIVVKEGSTLEYW